jgi:ABC-type transporter Mla MlaB component
MFRAEIQWLANGPTLKMEGRLVGDWAEQARLLVTREVVPQGLIVDLSDLSYVDSMGEQLLKWLASVRAEFFAGNVYAAGICERLRLPLLGNMPTRRKQRHGRTDEANFATQSHAS